MKSGTAAATTRQVTPGDQREDTRERELIEEPKRSGVPGALDFATVCATGVPPPKLIDHAHRGSLSHQGRGHSYAHLALLRPAGGCEIHIGTVPSKMHKIRKLSGTVCF